MPQLSLPAVCADLMQTNSLKHTPRSIHTTIADVRLRLRDDGEAPAAATGNHPTAFSLSRSKLTLGVVRALRLSVTFLTGRIAARRAPAGSFQPVRLYPALAVLRTLIQYAAF